jgi:hypothetical protein
MEATDEAELRLARGVDHVLNLDMAQAEAEVAPFRTTLCGHALLYAAVNTPPCTRFRSFWLRSSFTWLGNRWPRFGRC